jgi:putative transcriptional regulator
MIINAGTFLKSTAALHDTVFENTLLFITEHNASGATGFVVNKLFPRKLNELVEFNSSIAFPLYNGGPVAIEKVFFIHRRPDLIDGGQPITNGIFLGGNFKQAVGHINRKTLTEKDIKIFIGYCGWDDNELEEEVAEGSWEIAADTLNNVFAL